MANGDLLMKLTGAKSGWIKGEARYQGFEDWVEVESCSYSLTAAGSTRMSMGSGSGAPVMTDIQITKRLDRASNALFNAALNAEHLTEVEFQMRIGSGDKPQTAQKIVLTNGIVTGVHSSGSGAHVIETITLSFEKFKAAYQQQDAKGNKVGGPVEVELDLTKRK